MIKKFLIILFLLSSPLVTFATTKPLTWLWDSASTTFPYTFITTTRSPVFVATSTSTPSTFAGPVGVGLTSLDAMVDVQGVADGTGNSNVLRLHVPEVDTGSAIRIDGQYSDALSFEGVLGTTNPSIINLFSANDNSMWLPSGSTIGAWSFGAAPKIVGNNNADYLYGFTSSPYSSGISLPYNGTVGKVHAFDAQATFISGTASEYSLFDGSISSIAGAAVNNLYGLHLGNISGGDTSNYAIKTGDGDVYFGDNVHVVNTTEQLRLGYDTSNYWTSTIGSTGGLTMQGVGTGGAYTLAPTSGQSINLNLATTGDLKVNTNQLYVDTSAARVGINTATPATALEVNGTASSSAQFVSGLATAGGTFVAANASGQLIATSTPAGYTLQFSSTSISPADGAGWCIGAQQNSPPADCTTVGVYVPKAGTIKAAYCFSTETAGGAETSTSTVQVNRTTDYQISATLAFNSSPTAWSNSAMSGTVAAGDVLGIRFQSPTWASNPTLIRPSCVVYIE